MSHLLRFSLLLVAVVGAQAGLVKKSFTIASKSITLDGFTRNAALVNGQFPGPVLAAQKGDRIEVKVQNNLADPSMRRSTSVHWHGLLQSRNAHNDGPSFVTQCPIAPNNSYPYTLILGEQTGTYWYHSHLSTQYIDGIRGPLIIYDPDDPLKHMYDVDDINTIITLADWYHYPALGMEDAWLAGGPEPVPDSGLINGKGRYRNSPRVELARINVTKGKRYRFRIISMSAQGLFDFAISNHRLTVIEADGTEHHPYTVDSIRLLAGQRYSVVVTANQTMDNYWIRATQTIRNETWQPANRNFNGNLTYAVFHYNGAPDTEPTAPPPTTLPPGGVPFEEFNLVPLANPGPPGGSSPPDQVFNLTFDPLSPNGNKWIINGVQYQPPSVPTLLNILANDLQFGSDENTFVLKPNANVEISFIGGPLHAFHLHGHTFDVIQGVGGPPNYVNPPRRDVVEGGGPVDKPVRIRFRTDNPGPWFLHCHIDFHLEGGLAAVFAENPTGILRGSLSVKPNRAWQELCRKYNSLPPEFQ